MFWIDTFTFLGANGMINPTLILIKTILILITIAGVILVVIGILKKSKKILHLKVIHNEGKIDCVILATANETEKITKAIFDSKDKLEKANQNDLPYKPVK